MAVQGTLYITFVEKEGPYIKLWGQPQRNVPIGIEHALAAMKSQFDVGHHMPNLSEFVIDKVLCAKFRDGNYYRAKVTNTDVLNKGLVEVQFIDYGNKDFIPLSLTRTMPSVEIQTYPPQASAYLECQPHY